MLDPVSVLIGAIGGGALVAIAVITGHALHAHQPTLGDRLPELEMPLWSAAPEPAMHILQAPETRPAATVLHTYPAITEGYCAVSTAGEVVRYSGDLAGESWKNAFELKRELPDKAAGWTFYHDGQPRGHVERA